MKLKRYNDGWFLTGNGERIGPFESKKEAEDEYRELLRFYGSEIAVFSTGTQDAAGAVSDVGSGH